MLKRSAVVIVAFLVATWWGVLCLDTMRPQWALERDPMQPADESQMTEFRGYPVVWYTRRLDHSEMQNVAALAVDAVAILGVMVALLFAGSTPNFFRWLLRPSLSLLAALALTVAGAYGLVRLADAHIAATEPGLRPTVISISAIAFALSTLAVLFSLGQCVVRLTAGRRSAENSAASDLAASDIRKL